MGQWDEPESYEEFLKNYGKEDPPAWHRWAQKFAALLFVAFLFWFPSKANPLWDSDDDKNSTSEIVW
ncbi:hypothetical protein TrRE_jg8044 [Triparma retinervis]|uniref:Uncharacterized protein n=1 Tax=Triparma retinervis TaxID=2557542 RepID=A0A9W7A1E1_9STRA|nr:hypothetical protein TrRE_jg8044 [Triparma retinervis]